MLWFLLALLGRSCYAGCNVIDAKNANHHFSSKFAIIFYTTCLISLFFIPFIAIYRPALPPVSLWGWFIIAGAFQVLYLFPYFQALKLADTSVVTNLFALGRVFVPILAFVLVKEHLSLQAYLGILVIFAASFTGIFSPTQRKLNLQAFGLMALSCLILSLSTTIYKLTLATQSWQTSYVSGGICALITLLAMAILPSNRKAISTDLPILNHAWKFIVGSSCLAFTANGLMLWAAQLAPVSFTAATSVLQPFMVLFFNTVLFWFGINPVKESLSREAIVQKSWSFLLAAAGTALILF